MSLTNIQSTSKYSVFEQTQVSLNSDFLSLIPTSVDQASFFIDIAEELQLTFCEQIDNGCPVFLGMWNNILKAEKRLLECLSLWEEESAMEGTKTSEIDVDQISTGDLGEVSILIPEGYVPSVLPGGSHLYLVPTDSALPSQLAKPSPTKTEDKRKQKVSSIQEHSYVKELYVDIAVNSPKNNDSSQDFDIKISSPEKDKNPLDKLCELLCIGEDETVEKIEKSLCVAEKKRNYEENLPFRYFCDKCSFKAKRENHLVKHLKLHNENKVIHCCDQCDFKSICERSLLRHKITHSNSKLTCKLCTFETNRKGELIRHKQSKHGPNYSKTVKCRHCEFFTTKPRDMMWHLKLLHPKAESTKIWKCTKCPYKSKLRAHLNRHMNDMHEGVRRHLCHFCGKIFKRTDTLQQHKAIHGEPSRTFGCQHCGKVFIKLVHLQEHQAKHTTERPFLCDVCGKSYKTMQATKRHKRFMHSDNVRMWPCPRNCGRTFKYRSHLCKHVKQPCKKPHRLKTEATIVPEIISGANIQEEVIATPITIQVVYTEPLDSKNQHVIIK